MISKINIFLVFVSVVILSCKKDIEPAPSETSNTTNHQDSTFNTLPDSVFYFDIADTTIQSVISWSAGTPCAQTPYPHDSLASLKLDLDGDISHDITFTCSTDSFYMGSASNPCGGAQYSYAIAISLNSTDSLVVPNSFSPPSLCDSLSYGETIGNNNKYSNGGCNIRIFIPGIIKAFELNKDIYIGYKLLRNGKTMYGWILLNYLTNNGLKIKSYAINKQNGNNIDAGQVQ